MNKPAEVTWLDIPDDHDYEAAQTYLQRLYGRKKARRWAKKLNSAEIRKYAAKDIPRASETPIAEVQAFNWVKQQKEIASGTPLSPILLIRREDGSALSIADGFHRLCAVLCADQKANVPCKIV